MKCLSLVGYVFSGFAHIDTYIFAPYYIYMLFFLNHSTFSWGTMWTSTLTLTILQPLPSVPFEFNIIHLPTKISFSKVAEEKQDATNTVL